MRCCVIWFAFAVVSQLYGQKIIGKWTSENDRNLLRWAVVDSAAFGKVLQGGYILERTENDSVFTDPFRVKQFFVFPDSAMDPHWERMAKEDPRVLFVHQLFFLSKPFPASLLHLSAAAADQNFNLAMAMGWGFIDSTVLSGRNYFYRIRIPGEDEIPLLRKADSLSMIHSLQARQFGKKVQLFWKVDKERDRAAGYFIERRITGRTFERLNLHPVVELRNSGINDSVIYFDDTLVQNQTKYEYRLRAIDHFGRYGPWSEIAAITYYEPVSGEIRIADVKGIGNGSCELSVLGTENGDSDILIYWGPSVDGEFIQVEKVQCGEDLFKITDFRTSCYFKVCRKGFAGDSICSLPYYYFIPDTLPPDAPKNLQAKVFPNGIVELKWQSSPDKKCLGYRLFRSNSRQQEFVEVNGQLIKAPVFFDTLSLASLSPSVWYYAAVLDSLYNNSKHSDTIRVERPDTIPPPSPVIFSMVEREKVISILARVNETNTDSVFVHFKSEQGSKRVVVEQDSGWVRYTDSLLPTGFYQVCLSAEDQSGNRSFSLPRTFRISIHQSEKIVIDSLEVDRVNRKIEIMWTPHPEVWSITLYRGKNTEPLSTYMTFTDSRTSFSDQQLYMGNSYSYQLSILLKDGTKLLSPIRTVTY